MTRCLFASDLHGRPGHWRRLLETALAEAPRVVLLGGDLLPPLLSGPAQDSQHGFIAGTMAPGCARLREALGARAPAVLLVPGNDDSAAAAEVFEETAAEAGWTWLHGRSATVAGHEFFGYGCVPPTPFQLKDWERFDVSRYVDPGCTSPETGSRTVAVDELEVRWGTIAGDLEALAAGRDLGGSVWLFHAPPYDTALDRAALDGRSVEHVPLDVHVGSIAIRRFIAARQPLVALHGHVHESARLTGSWRERIGATHCLSAAHDGPELALVRFDLEDPAAATRELLAT